MSKEVNEKACFLDMPNGLSKEIDYPQKFVRALNPGKYPCNYAAEKVDSSKVMNMAMGK